MLKNKLYSNSYASIVKEIYRGLIYALPVLIGYIPFGLLLGTQAAQKGISPLEMGMMTGLNFGGGSEFAVMPIWSPMPNILTIVLITILVNSRYLIMGITFAPLIYHLPPKKALPTLFAMSDESWALGMADAARRKASGLTPFSGWFYTGLAGAMWLTWAISTIAGVIVGPMLGDITTWGFDMAFPAVFFVLLKGMWKGLRASIPWVVSLVCATVTYQFISNALYVPVGVAAGFATILLMGDKN